MIRGAGARLGVTAARDLASIGAAIGPGLTDAEFDRVERAYGFEFADDHRAFLAAGLPSGGTWPDWRAGAPDALRKSLDWPVDGVLFDVERNGWWYPDWGDRPADPRAALDTARRALDSVPTMVPVYGHRYLPAGRGTAGHPVLSMWQTDIIYYGVDLVDYVHREFGRANRPGEGRHPVATVPFWRDLVL